MEIQDLSKPITDFEIWDKWDRIAFERISPEFTALIDDLAQKVMKIDARLKVTEKELDDLDMPNPEDYG